jgi:N-hydroxyarylamine O-acetyltransferase
MFDLQEYLGRVGYSGSVAADLDTLRAIHRAHVNAIPFENLDVQMGRGVSLDAEALQTKLVRQRRGGYCFEQNTLLAMALQSIGFDFRTREARVRQRTSGAVLPRTHMVLSVDVAGHPWLADVGFGGDGLVEPIPMDASEHDQLGLVYRVQQDARLAVLQRRSPEGWDDLYAVLPDPVYPIDLLVGNWYTSTFPGSPFVLNLTAQRIAGDTRHVLRNLTYTTRRGDVAETREIDRAQLVPLLRDTFGIDLPDEQTFFAIDGRAEAPATV